MLPFERQTLEFLFNLRRDRLAVGLRLVGTQNQLRLQFQGFVGGVRGHAREQEEKQRGADQPGRGK